MQEANATLETRPAVIAWPFPLPHKIQGVGLVNKWIDDIRLMSFGDFSAYDVVGSVRRAVVNTLVCTGKRSGGNSSMTERSRSP